MLIYQATQTLEGYLPELEYTDDKGLAEVMLVGGKQVVLSEFPKLRGIFKTGVGTDNLPFVAAAQRGIEIGLPSSVTRDVIYEETAAFTCHLILTGLYTGHGDWLTWQKVDRPQLAGRRLLIIGAGRIGQRVMDKMAAFMKVDSFDTAHDTTDVLKEKVCVADCVSLHVPLSDETRNLFDAKCLGWMKDGSLLVNTARGPVIDESALFHELNTGRLRAAIDVFWDEPYHGLLTGLPHDRLIRSPHIASTCKEFIQGTADDFLKFIAKLDQH